MQKRNRSFETILNRYFETTYQKCNFEKRSNLSFSNKFKEIVTSINIDTS